MTYQRKLEYTGVVGMVLIMLATALAFYRFPNQTIFDRFSQDLRFTITPALFVVLALVGAASYPFQLFAAVGRWRVEFRRMFWSLSASPIILYTIPVGWYLWQTQANGFAVVAYFALYFLISFAGACLYRE